MGSPNEVEILSGSLDQGVLASPSAVKLTKPTGGQFWCKRFIEGVTDGISEGTCWLEGSAQGFKLPWTGVKTDE